MYKFVFAFCLLLSACHKDIYVLKQPFASSPVPPVPDYSKKISWASLPVIVDAADSIPFDAAFKDNQSTANADVFFIYPTIFTEAPTNKYSWNADVEDNKLNVQIQLTTLLNQASIFNGSCRIYSPYYRQAHLYSFYTSNQEEGRSALDLAYVDVKAAFEYYLKYYNEGRPIVIASHSQGSYHGERLIKEYFDGKELQKQLVAAYLIGRAIRPDSFKFIHPAETPDGTGVWVSWNTFARNYLPNNYENIFKGSLSTNPLLWNSSEDYASEVLNTGGVGLHFTFVPHLVDAQNHSGVLWVNKPHIKGRWLIGTKRWHRADMNFFYMNIRENVALRVEKYLKNRGNTSIEN